MPNSGLRGPFSLKTAEVNGAVTVKSAGAYALGYTNQGNTFIIQYVGRSDDDVNARLQKHVIEAYPQFKFEYYPSAKAAFEKECNLYHDFNPPDNKVHPARPENANWGCPRCAKFSSSGAMPRW